MQQGDLIRTGMFVAAAGVGAVLTLAGAELTGRLGSSTTVEQITSTPAQASKIGSSSSQGDLSVQQIYRLDSPGVVQISSRRPSPSAGGLGSGFVIDKAGHILTSNHVISGARGVRVSFSGTDQLEATVVGKDPSTDVAVLQVAAHSRSLSPLPLGDSDQVQIGDPVVAIGNSPALSRTATVGIVSSVQHGVDELSGGAAYTHTIQTDATINHGNSGGPLINTRGQVIGISAQLDPAEAATAASAAGIGFAIPIDTVKAVVEQLLTTGKVQHAYLGVEAAPVTESLARSFALPSGYGLIVQSVTPGSAAALAGLRAGSTAVAVSGESYRLGGDIIVAAAGKPITSEAQLRDVIKAMKPGQTLALQIWRGSAKQTIHVRLGRPPG
jgi:S1-C subfamily serine protease